MALGSLNIEKWISRNTFVWFVMMMMVNHHWWYLKKQTIAAEKRGLAAFNRFVLVHASHSLIPSSFSTFLRQLNFVLFVSKNKKRQQQQHNVCNVCNVWTICFGSRLSLTAKLARLTLRTNWLCLQVENAVRSSLLLISLSLSLSHKSLLIFWIQSLHIITKLDAQLL